jgi:cardiolipin synthase
VALPARWFFLPVGVTPCRTRSRKIISAIDSASHEVLLTSAYVVPDRQLIASLKVAVARGVDVRVVLPGMSGLRAGAQRRPLLLRRRDGVNIHERKDALLHPKTARIDGVWSSLGSINLGWRSVVHNQEVNAVILGAEFDLRMRKSFDDDLARSQQITLQRWQQCTFGARLLEQFGRPWRYWL